MELSELPGRSSESHIDSLELRLCRSGAAGHITGETKEEEAAQGRAGAEGGAVEPTGQTAADTRLQRRGWRFGARRGVSSQFVGSAIAVLSTYAVATLAMNFGKSIQERRLRPNGN
ncbi:hypothetical protein EYF80_031236 [Liparis tanakae]|uniref:Uncharacterized protein n=1 Tax=Liparis tanakae TaxID=230148 RepID=A0A4Z2GYL2_9TELE|nr:hypothetical protein EYF80_031236 [Liparis tanakae]